MIRRLIKKIKPSKRGLTFSMSEDFIGIGQKYRYEFDKKKNQLVIIPDDNGKLKVSKKKTGATLKPLFDLRSKEVRDAISDCEYIEIMEEHGKIIASIREKIEQKLSEAEQIKFELGGESAKILTFVSKEDKHHKTSEIIISNKLLDAVGSSQSVPYLGGSYSSNPVYLNLSSSSKTAIKKDIKRIYSLASFFSGAGLLDYAFSKDKSFDIVFANDFDKDATESYKLNIGDHIVHDSILNIDSSMVPDVDVIVGGVPCTSFSGANRHKRLEDHESYNLVDEFIRIVYEKNPLVWAIENVPQFLTANNGDCLNRVLNGLGHYEITHTVVKDNVLGGFTKRKRAIIIGSRIGKINMPVFSLVNNKKVKDALCKVDATWFNFNDVTIPRQSTIEYMKQVRPGHNYKDIESMKHLDRHSNVYRRLAMDEVAPTLTNWRKVNLSHPVENRILSVAEAAALMGLDKNFKVVGSLNSKQQQIGNGVPQSIAETLCRVIKKALDKFYKRSIPSFAY